MYHNLFNCFPTYGHLAYFLYFANTNIIAASNLMHVYFHVVERVSTGESRSGVPESNCKCLCTFVRYYQISLQKGYYNFISREQCKSVCFPRALTTECVVLLSDFASLTDDK